MRRLEIIDEGLASTGKGAADTQRRHRWRAEYALQFTNRIKHKRMLELEMAEWAITKLANIITGQARPDSIFTTPELLRLSHEIQGRLRWGQQCISRIVIKDTNFGALKAGQRSVAKVHEDIEMGRMHGKTRKEMMQAEYDARNKGEADHLAAAALSSPRTKRRRDNGRDRGRGRGRARKGGQGRGRGRGGGGNGNRGKGRGGGNGRGRGKGRGRGHGGGGKPKGGNGGGNIAPPAPSPAPQGAGPRKENRTCLKCNKVGHIAKDYKQP
jgi:hypothetical protein